MYTEHSPAVQNNQEAKEEKNGRKKREKKREREEGRFIFWLEAGERREEEEEEKGTRWSEPRLSLYATSLRMWEILSTGTQCSKTRFDRERRRGREGERRMLGSMGRCLAPKQSHREDAPLLVLLVLSKIVLTHDSVVLHSYGTSPLVEAWCNLMWGLLLQRRGGGRLSFFSLFILFDLYSLIFLLSEQ